MSLTKKDTLQKNTLTNQVDANITNLTSANLTSAKAVVKDISITGSITIPNSSIPASAIIGGIVTTTATNDIDVINPGDDMYLGKSSQNIYIGNVDQSSDYATNSENDIGTHFQNIAYFDNHIQTTYDSTFLIDTTLDFKFRKPGTERAFFRLYDSTGEAIFSVSDANKPAQTYFKNTLHLTNGAIVDGGKLTTANIIGVVTAVSPLINFNESVVSGMNSLTITSNLTSPKLTINGATASTFTTMPTVGANPLITAATVAANYGNLTATNSWSGSNNFTTMPTAGGNPLITAATANSTYGKLAATNAWSGNNSFTLPPTYNGSPFITTAVSNLVFGNLTANNSWTGTNTFNGVTQFQNNVYLNQKPLYLAGNADSYIKYALDPAYNLGGTSIAGYEHVSLSLAAAGATSNSLVLNIDGCTINGGLISNSISAPLGIINFQGNELSNVGKINGLDKSKIGYLSDVTSNIQSQINGAFAAAAAASAAGTGAAAGAYAAAVAAQLTADGALADALAAQATADGAANTAETAKTKANNAKDKADLVQTNLNNAIDQHCAHFSTSFVGQMEETYCIGYVNFYKGALYTDSDVWFGYLQDTWTTRINGSTGTIITKIFKIGTQTLESLNMYPKYPVTIDENGIDTIGFIKANSLTIRDATSNTVASINGSGNAVFNSITTPTNTASITSLGNANFNSLAITSGISTNLTITNSGSISAGGTISAAGSISGKGNHNFQSTASTNVISSYGTTTTIGDYGCDTIIRGNIIMLEDRPINMGDIYQENLNLEGTNPLAALRFIGF